MKYRFYDKIYSGTTIEEKAKIQGAREVLGVDFPEPYCTRFFHLKAEPIVRLIGKRMSSLGYAVGELYAVARDLREDEIYDAIRYRDEAELKKALCDVLELGGYDDSYCQYVTEVDWLIDEECNYSAR